MSIISAASITWPLGADAALIPRTVEMAEAWQTLLEVNYERLALWFPGFNTRPTLESTQADLERRGQAWLDGTQLPMAVGIAVEGGWRLIGAVNLLIDVAARSGEVGYWLDAEFEGRGLVTRAATAVLGQAFGPLGLDRVTLLTLPDNTRSRSVAQRLGFTQEGVLREAAAFSDGRRDEVVYGLLAREWHQPANLTAGGPMPLRGGRGPME